MVELSMYMNAVFILPDYTVQLKNTEIHFEKVAYYQGKMFEVADGVWKDFYTKDFKKYYMDAELSACYETRPHHSKTCIKKILYADSSFVCSRYYTEVLLKPLIFQILQEKDYNMFAKTTPCTVEMMRYLFQKTDTKGNLSYDKLKQTVGESSKFREIWYNKYLDKKGRIEELEREIGAAYMLDIIRTPAYVRIGIEFREICHGNIKEMVNNNRKKLHDLLFLYYDEYEKKNKKDMLLPFECYEYNDLRVNTTQLWVIMGLKPGIEVCLEGKEYWNTGV